MSNSPTAPPQVLDPVALALSAKTFTDSIDSWIPKDFGIRKSEQEIRRDFELALRPVGVGENDHLGVGHPSLTAPRKTISSAGYGALQKKLKDGKKVNVDNVDETVGEGGGEQEEEDEEGESRSRSVGRSKKSVTHDLLSGRNKAKKRLDGSSTLRLPRTDEPVSVASPSDPLLVEPGRTFAATSGKSSARQGDDDHREIDSVTSVPAYQEHQIGALKGGDEEAATPETVSSAGVSGPFPLPGPLALDSPRAKRILMPDSVTGSAGDTGSRDTSDGEGRGDDGDEVKASGGKMSKTQMTREKRRRKRLAERA